MLTALEQILAATRVSLPEPKTRATGWLNDSSILVRILDVVKNGGDWPLSVLAAALGETEHSTKAALCRLLQKSKIVKVGHRKRAQGGRPEAIYRRK